VQARPVKLGPARGEQVVVLDGLAPGEKVVVEGADRLREGATVTLPGPDREPGGPGRRPVAKNDAS